MPDGFRYRLLFVGVNAVPGGTWLHAPARDAKAVSERFRGWGYDAPACHRLLIHQHASRSRILSELRRAIAQADLDLLLIYWAGHLSSAGRLHVLATNGDTPDAPAEAIGVEILTAALGLSAGARHRVLILDACNAVAAKGELAGLSRSVAGGECAAVFAAGGSDELSREALRRGHFTGALLEQLPPRGGPPKIDLLQALRTGADQLVARRREQPFVGVYGSGAPLHLPDLRQIESARSSDTRKRA